MDFDLRYLGIYLLAINFIGFLLVGIDKHKAKKKKWRIPEKNFFILGLFGGALGIYGGMQYFRHKTQHRLFVYGIPMVILLNFAVIVFVMKYVLWN